MGLFDTMRTSVSGMAAQANRFGTIGDNIANTNTIGYKSADAEFSTLILQAGESNYVSGSVQTQVRHNIGTQGSLSFTTSSTDLAISGNGFFVVSGSDGQNYLTRSGSFVKDGNGNLVNTAGFKLMGYSIAASSGSGASAGGAGLVPVNIGSFALQASPSTSGQFFANLPSDATIVSAPNLPSANASSADFSGKSSLVAYDNLGGQVNLDVYTAKSASGQWEVSVYNHASASAGGGFPYSSGPLASDTLSFDTMGQLAAGSPSSLSFTVPGGSAFTLDLTQSSQLASPYAVLSTNVNGNAPSGIQDVKIGSDGTLEAIFGNGQRSSIYQIPVGNVPSPDNLETLPGNVYSVTNDSGGLVVGTAGIGGLGTIASDALEQSNVDLASELTTMISAERSYGANSKVFQTGSDLTQIVLDLKR